jgi:hypothetical protein
MDEHYSLLNPCTKTSPFKMSVLDRYNIRTDLLKIGRECVDWIHLALAKHQWRILVNTVTNLLVSGIS